MKQLFICLFFLLLICGCSGGRLWNDWKDAHSVRNLFIKASNENKTYYSQFDWYSPRTSASLQSACKQKSNIDLLVYGVDFYYASGTWFTPSSIEKNKKNLVTIVKEMWEQHHAIPCFSWHLENPYVPSGFKESMGCRYRYDKSIPKYPKEHQYVIREILSGKGGSKCGQGNINGKNNSVSFRNPQEWFECRCREVSNIINEMVDKDGKPIPFIFRLWHECEDNWHWWGPNSVTSDDYKAFFILTEEKIKKYAPNAEILWAYCPDSYWKTEEAFMQLYPGDRYVDIIGYDDYRFGKSDEDFVQGLNRAKIVTSAAHKRKKIAALFETNNNKDNQNDFFSKRLDKLLHDSFVNFSLVQIWKATYYDSNDAIKDRKVFLRKKNILKSNEK